MYDEDQFASNKVLALNIPTPTTNDANEVVARLQFFTKVKLLEARAIVTGTAYDEATASLLIYVDDGSIGACVFSTATVGQTVDATLTDTDVSSTSSVELQLTHDTATGMCQFLLHYQEMFE